MTETVIKWMWDRKRPWGPASLLYNGYRVSFSGVKRPWRGVYHPPASSKAIPLHV